MIDVLEGLGKELKHRGLHVVKVDGWKSRGVRDDEGELESFDPRGVLNHHTASPLTSGNLPCLGICTNGRPDLRGPLCQILLGRDATVALIAAHRANHAGLGGPTRGIPLNMGNPLLFGIEWENNGIGEPYSRIQWRAGVLLNAVLLKRMDEPASMCFEHREYAPTRKTDRKVDADAFRAQVRGELKRLRKAS